MLDTVPATSDRHTAIEMSSKLVSSGAYASERLNLSGTGKIAQGESGRQPDSRDATVRDDTGGVRRRGLWKRLNGHGKRKRRDGQAFA
jgi:hypothetical protein